MGEQLPHARHGCADDVGSPYGSMHATVSLYPREMPAPDRLNFHAPRLPFFCLRAIP